MESRQVLRQLAREAAKDPARHATKGIMNRQHRRAAFKAVQCIKRATKVPGGVLETLNPKALDEMAAAMGKRIGRFGVVLPARQVAA